MTSEPVSAVIVTERTSELSIIKEWSSTYVSQAIQYKKVCKSDAELYMKY